MAEEQAKSPRARMFVALDLPERVRGEITTWGETELPGPVWRRVPPEALHVTLAFLGDRPLGEVGRIEAAMQRIAEVPVLLELLDPVVRPVRGRPRLVALPVESGPVEAPQLELAEALACEGLYRPGGKPFWPHVTVARARPEGRGSQPMSPLEIPSGPSPAAWIGSFDAVRVSLYRSELQPSGAHYVPLAQVELPGWGWQ